MDIAELRTLYDYNYWVNRQVMETAAGVSRPEWDTPRGAGQASLRSTFVHILSAEWIWRMRCQERISPTEALPEEEFEDLEAIQKRWREEEVAMRAFLSTLDSEQLQEVVEYQNTKGVPLQNPLWQILVHVVHHGTQHRSEIALYLTTIGRSPGDLDLILFLRQQADESTGAGRT